jgi:hypothetical protein
VKYWSSDRLPIFQWVVEASSKPFSVEKRRKYRVLYESFRLSCEEMGLDWNKALVAVIAKVLLMKKDDIKMEVAA